MNKRDIIRNIKSSGGSWSAQDLANRMSVCVLEVSRLMIDCINCGQIIENPRFPNTYGLSEWYEV
jgi:hypothetical protein